MSAAWRVLAHVRRGRRVVQWTSPGSGKAAHGRVAPASRRSPAGERAIAAARNLPLPRSRVCARRIRPSSSPLGRDAGVSLVNAYTGQIIGSGLGVRMFPPGTSRSCIVAGAKQRRARGGTRGYRAANLAFPPRRLHLAAAHVDLAADSVPCCGSGVAAPPRRASSTGITSSESGRAFLLVIVVASGCCHVQPVGQRARVSHRRLKPRRRRPDPHRHVTEDGARRTEREPGRQPRKPAVTR